MSDLLGQIASGLDLVTTIGEFVNGIRQGKVSENREAREFANQLERLLIALRRLGCAREEADGQLTPRLRVEAMATERRSWAMLHKIDATIVPLAQSGKRRKKMLKNFFLGSAGRQVVTTNNIIKSHIMEANKCRNDIEYCIRDYNARNPSLSYLNPPAVSEAQQPRFRPLKSKKI